MSKIYVIGGANIDLFAKSDQKIARSDKNPATISLTFGGVGRNIAENLIHLNEDVYFVSLFANDFFGKMVYDRCKEIGFKMDYSIFSDDFPSSMFLAIMDQNNDMFMGMSDMRIIESLVADQLSELEQVLEEDDYLIVDNNLNEKASQEIFKRFKGKKITDAISVSKVMKLQDSLKYIDILKVNQKEAERLYGQTFETKEEAYKALDYLHDQGVKEVLITTKDGVYIHDGQKHRFIHDAVDKHVLNTTGAGDAFLAAYVSAHYHKLPFIERVHQALAAAILTVRDEKTVSELSQEKIQTLLKEIHIEGGQ